MIPVHSDLDFGGRELLNPRIHQIAGDPASPLPGSLWYDTGSNTLKYHDGTENISLIKVTQIEHSTLFLKGDVAVKTGDADDIMTSPGNITGIWATIRTAPTGADLVVSLKNNGLEVETLTIPAGQTSASTTFTAAVAEGDVLRVDISQIGSTNPGSNLTVKVRREH